MASLLPLWRFLRSPHDRPSECAGKAGAFAMRQSGISSGQPGIPPDVRHSGSMNAEGYPAGPHQTETEAHASTDRWTMISALSCMRNNQSKEQHNEPASYPQHLATE